ncbi:MAG: restriction endonuclease subunit S, partial [Synergistaceae bacterium]|nr:restriction endonuclease subunit S [Synergistaceae bacterium]
MSCPGGWKRTTLGEEYLIIMGQSPDSSSYNDYKRGLPLVQGNADIENGITSPQRYTSKPTKICDDNAVLLSVRAPVGTVSRVNQRVCLGRGVCAIAGKITNFVYYLMKYHANSWKRLEQGSTFTAISVEDIKEFEIFLPPLAEQQAIADTLAAFDTHIANLTELIAKKKAIRDGALDDLMSGRT